MDELKSQIYRALWLSESQLNSLGTLCIEANKLLDTQDTTAVPDWVSWLDGISHDSHTLLEKIRRRRLKLRKNAETPKLINKSVAHLRENARVDISIRKQLARSIEVYKVPTEITFDEESSKLQRQLIVPEFPPVSILRMLILATALHNGEWQLVRRCRLPECGEFFCDTPGRRAMEYCPQTNHRLRHQRQKPRRARR